MASDPVQTSWTGCSGETLLLQSIAFVRAIEARVPTLMLKPLRESAILDYGCGGVGCCGSC
jgi:hypothetical protein